VLQLSLSASVKNASMVPLHFAPEFVNIPIFFVVVANMITRITLALIEIILLNESVNLFWNPTKSLIFMPGTVLI
jgi:hypothetical protein